ncbi:conserved Plasmodium protein, unknown function [Plasmodium ovale]|uniref:Uncharacterized protein n=1 Tax=Plasmodium ovale TaxID=36330 RepID=A0A1D3U844_PLAOA|nr:conserved Plasmodium protein, unknown function [Plasmodium ovale]
MSSSDLNFYINKHRKAYEERLKKEHQNHEKQGSEHAEKDARGSECVETAGPREDIAVEENLNQVDSDYMYALKLSEALNGSTGDLNTQRETCFNNGNQERGESKNVNACESGSGDTQGDDNVRKPDSSYVECLLGTNTLMPFCLDVSYRSTNGKSCSYNSSSQRSDNNGSSSRRGTPRNHHLNRINGSSESNNILISSDDDVVMENAPKEDEKGCISICSVEREDAFSVNDDVLSQTPRQNKKNCSNNEEKDVLRGTVEEICNMDGAPYPYVQKVRHTYKESAKDSLPKCLEEYVDSNIYEYDNYVKECENANVEGDTARNRLPYVYSHKFIYGDNNDVVDEKDDNELVKEKNRVIYDKKRDDDEGGVYAYENIRTNSKENEKNCTYKGNDNGNYRTDMVITRKGNFLDVEDYCRANSELGEYTDQLFSHSVREKEHKGGDKRRGEKNNQGDIVCGKKIVPIIDENVRDYNTYESCGSHDLEATDRCNTHWAGVSPYACKSIKNKRMGKLLGVKDSSLRTDNSNVLEAIDIGDGKGGYTGSNANCLMSFKNIPPRESMEKKLSDDIHVHHEYGKHVQKNGKVTHFDPSCAKFSQEKVFNDKHDVLCQGESSISNVTYDKRTYDSKDAVAYRESDGSFFSKGWNAISNKDRIRDIGYINSMINDISSSYRPMSFQDTFHGATNRYGEYPSSGEKTKYNFISKDNVDNCMHSEFEANYGNCANATWDGKCRKDMDPYKSASYSNKESLHLDYTQTKNIFAGGRNVDVMCNNVTTINSSAHNLLGDNLYSCDACPQDEKHRENLEKDDAPFVNDFPLSRNNNVAAADWQVDTHHEKENERDMDNVHRYGIKFQWDRKIERLTFANGNNNHNLLTGAHKSRNAHKKFDPYEKPTKHNMGGSTDTDACGNRDRANETNLYNYTHRDSMHPPSGARPATPDVYIIDEKGVCCSERSYERSVGYRDGRNHIRHDHDRHASKPSAYGDNQRIVVANENSKERVQAPTILPPTHNTNVGNRRMQRETNQGFNTNPVTVSGDEESLNDEEYSVQQAIINSLTEL